MTLSRKILLCDVALLGVLLVLGVVALCGLRALQRHHETTANEYAELRRVEATGVHLAAASALLQSKSPDTTRASDELRKAVAEVEQFRKLQEQGPASSAGHERAEAQTIERSLARLKQVIDDLSSAAPKAS